VARAFALVALIDVVGLFCETVLCLDLEKKYGALSRPKVERDRGLPLTPISSLAEVFPPTPPISEAVSP
jgi:hypothetical protein